MVKVKFSKGRGRKLSTWGLIVQKPVKEAFERLKKLGMNFSVRILVTVAIT